MTHNLPVEGNAVQRFFKVEPAVIRSTLVGITTVVAVVTGKNVDTAWVEDALFVYAAVSPVIAGLLIRRAVSPYVLVKDLIARSRAESERNLRDRPTQ
jgi:hypothetical protein